MAIFVLVHGAWTGAHGWRKVRRMLARDGHEVFCPSLTGVGERVHLVSPQVDLTTHVQDVVNTICFEDLHDVVLVGHSYGGAVITAALAAVHDRVRELVYLDAFVPDDGDRLAALVGRPGPSDTALVKEWLMPPPARSFDDPDEEVWQNARRVPHPARCFSEPIRVVRPVEDYEVGLTYIKASADPPDAPGGSPFWDVAERVRSSTRWRYREIATNHMVASNRPHELAALLIEIAHPGG